MSLANVLLDVLGPVAVLVALGAVLGPRLQIDLGSLSRLAYWVFGPAFVFGLQTNMARSQRLAQYELYWGDANLLKLELDSPCALR